MLRLTKRAPTSAAVRTSQPVANPRLEALEKLALSDSSEREQAAAERLAACLAPVLAPWDEEVAKVLASSPNADMVARLRPVVPVSRGNLVDAERPAAQLSDDAPSAEMRLRIARMRGQHSGMKEAAERFLDFAPDATAA